MPFLGAVPLIAGALGAQLPTALAIALPAISGAFGMASGIARGDPISAGLGALEGATGGLGAASAASSAGGAASAAGQIAQGAQAAQAAAQGSTVAAPILQAGETAAKTADLATTVPKSLMKSINAGLSTPIDSTKPLEAVAPLTWGGEAPQSVFLPGGSAIPKDLGVATKGMSTMDAISSGLAGAGAATQGVMGIINAFRDKSRGGGINFGSINNYLPAMQGNNLGQLPQAPQFDGGVTKTPLNINVGDSNDLFYQLMNSFVG